MCGCATLTEELQRGELHPPLSAAGLSDSQGEAGLRFRGQLQNVPQIWSDPCFLVGKQNNGLGEDRPSREGFSVTLS